MSETRRRYAPEFKAGAVGIVVEARGPVVVVAGGLGVCGGVLGDWVCWGRALASGGG